MPLPLTVVDAFTSSPFGGNPAAIVLLERAADEGWMRQVAAELNLSETAFVVPRPDGDHDLRWFTPTVEVDLCGHATLAAAAVLGGTARFHTRSGLLSCTGEDDGRITLDLPAIAVAATSANGWATALGIGEVLGAWEGGGWTLVEAVSPADVEAATPDRALVMALGGHVVLVADDTAARSSGFYSVCRTFVPAAGIDEDPVTGSAHCAIAPWLGARTGRTAFRCHQASSRRGVLHAAGAARRRPAASAP